MLIYVSEDIVALRKEAIEQCIDHYCVRGEPRGIIVTDCANQLIYYSKKHNCKDPVGLLLIHRSTEKDDMKFALNGFTGEVDDLIEHLDSSLDHGYSWLDEDREFYNDLQKAHDGEYLESEQVEGEIIFSTDSASLRAKNNKMLTEGEGVRKVLYKRFVALASYYEIKLEEKYLKLEID